MNTQALYFCLSPLHIIFFAGWALQIKGKAMAVVLQQAKPCPYLLRVLSFILSIMTVLLYSSIQTFLSRAYCMSDASTFPTRAHVRHGRESKDDVEINLPSWSLCEGSDININNLRTAQEGVSATHRGIISQKESGTGEWLLPGKIRKALLETWALEGWVRVPQKWEGRAL